MLEAKKQAKKHDKALAESDETRAKHPALLVASTDAATVLTKATEQLVEVSATAELELVVAKNRRVADFKAVFIKLAEYVPFDTQPCHQPYPDSNSNRQL
jgi:hypothetical protein